MELAGLIKKASYVIANDTGPAHMAAHLDKKGTVLFGFHTSAKKLSIEIMPEIDLPAHSWALLEIMP